MKKTVAALALGLMLSGQMAMALTKDDVVADLQSAGYTRVEVRVGPTQIKVEAIRGTEKLETVYDAATGAILKTQVRAVGADDNTTPGVTVRERGRDFVRADQGSDGNDHNGKGDGRGDSSDDSDHGDDHNGSGSDDDGHDDDHHGSGHDDDNGDDNGHDDSNDGSDDDSNDD